MTPTKKQRRLGLTLTELLVVISVIIIVTAVLAPVLTTVLDGREVREAARQVNAYFQSARARARELGRPVGVVIRRSEANPETAYQLALAEQPPPFAGLQNNSRALVTVSGTLGQARLVLADKYPGDMPALEAEQSLFLIQCNDFIRFSYRGPKYRIIRKDINARLIRFRIGNNQTAPRESLPNHPVPYEIFRRPRQTAAAPLELPTGTAIRLELSGVGLTGNEIDGPLASSIGMMEFQAPKNTDGTYIEPMSPLTIMFDEQGRIDKIYRVLPPDIPGPCTALAVQNPPKRPQSNIYLFLARDGVTSAQSLLDGSNLWIAINPHTGLVTTAPNAVPDSQAIAGDQLDLSDVAASRQLAVSGQSIGGR